MVTMEQRMADFEKRLASLEGKRTNQCQTCMGVGYDTSCFPCKNCNPSHPNYGRFKKKTPTGTRSPK